MAYESEYYCECGTHEGKRYYPKYQTKEEGQESKVEFYNNITPIICIECRHKAPKGKVWKGGKYWGVWAVPADGWDTP